jgi:hypothetical protein
MKQRVYVFHAAPSIIIYYCLNSTERLVVPLEEDSVHYEVRTKLLYITHTNTDLQVTNTLKQMRPCSLNSDLREHKFISMRATLIVWFLTTADYSRLAIKKYGHLRSHMQAGRLCLQPAGL